jgi:hypothetical protein
LGWALGPSSEHETALALIAGVLAAAFARHLPPSKRRRNGTDADHAHRAEAAKTYLASRLCERITLDDLAGAVHASRVRHASRRMVRSFPLERTSHDDEKVPRVRLGNQRRRNQGQGRRQGDHRLLRRLRAEGEGEPGEMRRHGQVNPVRIPAEPRPPTTPSPDAVGPFMMERDSACTTSLQSETSFAGMVDFANPAG